MTHLVLNLGQMNMHIFCYNFTSVTHESTLKLSLISLIVSHACKFVMHHK